MSTWLFWDQPIGPHILCHKGYNECSLNIMITTPSLFANKGAFSSCVTNDRWCGELKSSTHSLFSWFLPELLRWSESISCSSGFSFLSPSFFFFFFFKLPLDWTRALMWGNISLLTSQALWECLTFPGHWHRWVDWAKYYSEILAAGDTCSASQDDQRSCYSPCRAGQWSELFHVSM